MSEQVKLGSAGFAAPVWDSLLRETALREAGCGCCYIVDMTGFHMVLNAIDEAHAGAIAPDPVPTADPASVPGRDGLEGK